MLCLECRKQSDVVSFMPRGFLVLESRVSLRERLPNRSRNSFPNPTAQNPKPPIAFEPEPETLNPLNPDPRNLTLSCIRLQKELAKDARLRVLNGSVEASYRLAYGFGSIGFGV